MSLENEGTDNPPRSATISSSLTKKRKIRGGFRAHSTKLSTDAKVLLSQDEPDILKTEHLSLSLKEKVKTLQHIDDEIFNLISDDDVEAEVINCEELRSEIQSLIVKLDAKTEALGPGQTTRFFTRFFTRQKIEEKIEPFGHLVE